MEKSNTLAERMKAYRRRNGLTQKQLGELLGIQQTGISLVENGKKQAMQETEAAFNALLEKEATPEAEAAINALREKEVKTEPPGKAASVLLGLLKEARQEMGQPMEPGEEEALSRAKPEELLSESALTREALEVQASRELLSGAKAFHKKREAARAPSGRKGE